MIRIISYVTMLLVLLICLSGCEQDKNPLDDFVGSYEGTYSGDSSGTWTAEIDQNGVMEADIFDSSGGQIFGKGSISPTGEFTLDTKGKVMERFSFASWKGKFAKIQGQVVGEGTWTAADDFNGTWEGKKID